MRRALLACLALAAASLRTARAQEGPSPLSVVRGEGAEDCPDAATLARAVARADARRTLSPVPDLPAAQRYDVAFSRTDAGYEVVIRVSGPRAGVRSVHDPGRSCLGVAEATVLTLSLLLDQDARSPEPLPLPLPPPMPTPPRDLQEVVPAGPSEPGALGVEATAGVAVGIVRPVAPLVSAGASWSRGPLAIGLEASWIPTEVLQLGPGTVDVWFAAATASACIYPLRSPLRLGACALGIAGLVDASAQGYTKQQSAVEPWVGGGLGAAASGPLAGRFGWRARAAGIAPVTAEGFSVDHVGTAYSPPPVAAVLDVGVSLSIY